MPNSDLYRAWASKSIISAFFLITSLYFRTIYPYSISAFTLLPTLGETTQSRFTDRSAKQNQPNCYSNQPNRVFAWFFISSGGSSLSKSLQPADLKTILQQCKSSPVPRKHTAWRAPTWVYVNHHHRILHYVNSYWQGISDLYAHMEDANVNTYPIHIRFILCIWMRPDLDLRISKYMCFFSATCLWVIFDLSHVRQKNLNWVTWTI